MAKRGRKASGIDRFAEDLGNILGTAQAKADSWLGQRQSIAKQLVQIRDEATHLLSKLGGGVATMAGSVKVGRGRGDAGKTARRGQGTRPGRPKGHKVSAAARLKMSIAAKKRWAERKAADKDKKIEKKADKKAVK